MKRLPTTLRLLCAGLLLMAASVPARAATNLLANPGFELAGGSYSGWFTFGSGVQLSKRTTDNIAHNDSTAAKVYGGFNGCPGAPVFNVGGFGQAFASVAGQTYSFSGYSFVSSADPMIGTTPCNSNRMIAKLVFFDALSGGNEIAGNEIILGNAWTQRDQWIPWTVTSPVPTNAKRVEALILFLQPACDGGSVFVDDLELSYGPAYAHPNVLANPTFASGLTGWSTFGNVYADTRNFTVHTAPGAAKLFSTFVVDSPSGMYQTTAAAPGSEWKFDLWVRNTCQESPITSPNDNFLVAEIAFKDGFGTEIGTFQSIVADSSSPLGTYVNKSVTATAPVGTASASAYLLFISPTLQGGAFFVDDLDFYQTNVAGVPAPVANHGVELAAPAPNPVRSSAQLVLTLPRADHIDLGIFDVAGRRVATVATGLRAAGRATLVWDGKLASGEAAPSGVYRAVLRTSDARVARSLVLAR